MSVSGIDVSHHNGVIDWAKVRNAGYMFAYIKATEGTSFLDTSYLHNAIQSKTAGLLAGSYHFLSHQIDPVKQAKWFLSVIGEVHNGDLPPAIDVEDDPFCEICKHLLPHNPNDLITRCAKFMDYVEAQTKRDMLFYTYKWFYRYQMKNTNKWGVTNPLWLARYDVQTPGTIGGWQYQTIWQYTSTGRVPGINGNVDLNLFNGSYDRLEVFAHKGS